MWGFEAVFESAHTGIVRDMVRIKLTQNLSMFIFLIARAVVLTPAQPRLPKISRARSLLCSMSAGATAKSFTT